MNFLSPVERLGDDRPRITFYSHKNTCPKPANPEPVLWTCMRAASATRGHSATRRPLVLTNLGNFWHLQENSVICLGGGALGPKAGRIPLGPLPKEPSTGDSVTVSDRAKAWKGERAQPVSRLLKFPHQWGHGEGRRR